MNIIIADDHKLTAQLLRNYLMSIPNLKIIDTVSNGIELIKSMNDNKTDLVICDISMPLMDGLRTLSHIQDKFNSTKVLILSIHHEKWIIEKAIENGASGYISKSDKKEEVLKAINNFHNNSIYLTKFIKKILSSN